jgi:hypothetical protein
MSEPDDPSADSCIGALRPEGMTDEEVERMAALLDEYVAEMRRTEWSSQSRSGVE